MPPLPYVEKNGVLIITLDDNEALNEGQAAGLRQVLYARLESSEGPKVAVDLSAIDYITSTGIALLIGTKRRVEARDGRLVLFGLRAHVFELFSTMRLVNLFEIAETEAQALELFPPPPSH